MANFGEPKYPAGRKWPQETHINREKAAAAELQSEEAKQHGGRVPSKKEGGMSAQAHSAADHHEREAAQRPYTLGATVPEAGTYMTTPTVRGDATTGTYDTDAGTRTDVTTGAEVNTPIGLPGEGPRHNVTAGTFDTRKGGPGGGDINAGDYDVDTGKHRDKVPIKPR